MRRIFFTIPTLRIKFHLLGEAPLLRMHGLEQVGTDLSFGFLAIKWGFVSGNNEAGLVGMHWVAWRVALMLKTKLNWCFQFLVPFHVGSASQELGCLLQAAPSCVRSARSSSPAGGDSTKLRGGCCPSACRQQDLVEHGFNAFPPLPNTELMLKGKTKTTALKDTWLGLPLPPLDAHWQGGMQAISAETPATRPTRHYHSTAAVYSRTDSLLSVGYGGFFHF